MIDTTNINSVFSARAVDRDGNKVGTVKQVYVDGNTGQPEFATVATGLFGTSESFVPLQCADFGGEGLRVGYDKDTIKDGPRIDSDVALSPNGQGTLHDYYRLGGNTDQASSGTAADEKTGAGYNVPAQGRHADDNAMTRSEERQSVEKERRPVGRARLRTHVVTEQQTMTVPVERVRRDQDTVTDQEGVSENVTHEEIDLDDDNNTGRR